MKKIYAAIDLGSDSIKVMVCEETRHKLHVLASTSVRSLGIRLGRITDVEMASKSLQLALGEIETSSGFHVEKALVNVPIENAVTKVYTGSTELLEPIKGEEITACLQDAILGKVNGMEEVVTTIPIVYQLDEKENIHSPLGMAGRRLSVKAAVTTIPKVDAKKVYEVMKRAGVEVVDVAFDIDGDYYDVKNDTLDSKIGAIINIGADKTTIGIYNKGIRIKSFVLPLGSDHIDRDIATIYRLDLGDARNLKENFAVATHTYADLSDRMEVETTAKEKMTIAQEELSEVVEARLKQILKLSKKNINLLTNREIRYIIITGGVSEMMGFQPLVEEVLGKRALTLSMMTMGARQNKYSSVLGMLRYFSDKLSWRTIDYSMFPIDTLERINSVAKKPLSKEGIVPKLFERFFESKEDQA